MEFIEVVRGSWTHVPVDPNNDGFNEMIIEKLEVERDVMWSPDVIVDPSVVTPFIPYQARFDYDVYLKIHGESTFEKHRYAVTRFEQ